MNDEEKNLPEEILAGSTEEGEASDQSGSRIAGNVPGNDLTEDEKPALEDQSEERSGKNEALLLGKEAGRDDPQVLAMPDPLGEDPHLRDEEDPRRGLSELRERLKDLEERLLAREAAYKRLESECSEFRELYPEVPLGSLSDGVWEDVQKGIPVAAAYALYERRRFLTAELAKRSNEENRKTSAGAILGSDEPYYSPAEVRAMSQEQVRENYDKILSSMQKWN